MPIDLLEENFNDEEGMIGKILGVARANHKESHEEIRNAREEIKNAHEKIDSVK